MSGRGGRRRPSKGKQYVQRKKDRQHIYKEALGYNFDYLDSHGTEVDEFDSEEHKDLHNEALTILHERLFDCTYRITNDNLSDHQKLVLRLYYNKGTADSSVAYDDVAGLLDINYTGVSHSIMGIKNNKVKNSKESHYGGSLKKIKKIAATDTETQTILSQIKELRSTYDIELAKRIIASENMTSVPPELYAVPSSEEID